MKYFRLFLIILGCICFSCKEEVPLLDLCSNAAYDIEIEVQELPYTGRLNGIIKVIFETPDDEKLAYSLNDTLYQEWGTFSGLSSGSYQLYIRDENDCLLTRSFTLAEIPLYHLTVEGGIGGGEYPAGASIQIEAFPPTFAMQFSNWEGNTIVLEDPLVSLATVIMPDSNTTVTSSYDSILYPLEVSNGSGSGTYPFGRVVAVTAKNPPADSIFSTWIGDISFLSNPDLSATVVEMPDEDISIRATFEYLQTISYSKDVAPLFVQYCTGLGCHITHGGNSEHALLTYEDQVAGATAIRPSILLRGMPPGSQMPQEAIDLIVEWIDSGTPNN